MSDLATRWLSIKGMWDFLCTDPYLDWSERAKATQGSCDLTPMISNGLINGYSAGRIVLSATVRAFAELPLSDIIALIPSDYHERLDRILPVYLR